MKIGLIGFLLGMLLLLIPVFLIYRLRLCNMRRFLISVFSMMTLVGIAGFCVYMLINWENIWLTILAGIVMAAASAVITIHRARLNKKLLFIPVLCGVFCGTFTVGLYVLLVVMRLHNPFDARFFIPVLGILTGFSIGLNAKALHIYYMGLHHHKQLYHYLLGNGSSHREAVDYFVRRSFQSVIHAMMKPMSTVVLSSTPLLLLVPLMGGADVRETVALQILFFLMIISSSLISLYITLWVGKKYTFDAYERLHILRKSKQHHTPSSSGAAPDLPMKEESQPLVNKEIEEQESLDI